jgi:large subunit ribosomal protein L25
MEKIVLNAHKRYTAGKGPARQLRRQGMIPGVYYAKGDSIPITLIKKELLAILKTEDAYRHIIQLDILDNEEKKGYVSLIKDHQVDPVYSELLHVDFMGIDLTKKMNIHVPIHVTTAQSDIKPGALMRLVNPEIEVRCLPDNIPSAIEVDVAHLNIGESLTVSQLKVGEGVEILTSPTQVVVMLVSEAKELEAAAAEEAKGQPKETAPTEKT